VTRDSAALSVLCECYSKSLSDSRIFYIVFSLGKW
jgi:hypothetical protein